MSDIWIYSDGRPCTSSSLEIDAENPNKAIDLETGEELTLGSIDMLVANFDLVPGAAYSTDAEDWAARMASEDGRTIERAEDAFGIFNPRMGRVYMELLDQVGIYPGLENKTYEGRLARVLKASERDKGQPETFFTQVPAGAKVIIPPVKLLDWVLEKGPGYRFGVVPPAFDMHGPVRTQTKGAKTYYKYRVYGMSRLVKSSTPE